MRTREDDVVINTKQLRSTLRQIIEAVMQGTSYTVLYRSRPAFRIVPVEKVRPVQDGQLSRDPLFGARALGHSEDGDLGPRHDEIIYGR